MASTGEMAPRRARLAASLLYATLVTGLGVWALPKAIVTPVLLIALGIPLVLRLVPRNYLYGVRTPRTLWTTDDAWYIQNTITGVAMIAIGVIRLAVRVLR